MSLGSKLVFFRGLGCRCCGGRCEKIAANAKLGCVADRNRVGSAGRLSVERVGSSCSSATATAAGQIAHTKYLMLIFVKSKMSLRANLANKSANYKCPKIDEQAKRVTSQLLSRGANSTGTIKYICMFVCLSIMLISQLSCAGISIS